jgi:hypothetical protein
MATIQTIEEMPRVQIGPRVRLELETAFGNWSGATSQRPKTCASC